jgi:tetratricopeptide (TPR) repeat protein
MNRIQKIHTGVLLVLILFAGVIYSNTFRSPFHFDSKQRVENNPALRIETLSVKALENAAFGKDSAKNRPVGNITFALNYYLDGLDPFGYHLVNVAIHVLAAFFLYLLIYRTLRLPVLDYDASQALRISFCAALLWLVHPVNTQSVTYLVQRFNSLAALFFLLAFYLYVAGRDRKPFWPWLLGCAVSWLIALGSKQNVVVLPFFIFLYEWFFFQDLDRKWLFRNLKYALVPVALFVLAAFLFLGTAPMERLTNIRDFALGEFTYGQRLLTQLRVVVFYLSLFFFPHPSRLNLDHEFPLSHSLIDPATTLLSLIALGTLLVLAVLSAKRHRLISFCLFWFFGTLLVESSVIPLAVIFEHRTYLPFALLSLLVVVLLEHVIRRPWQGVAVVVLVSALFGYWTYDRNLVYQDGFTLWNDILKKSPDNARAYNNLGTLVEKRDGMAAAVDYFRKAVELDPEFAEALNNLGRARFEQEQYPEALALFKRSLRARPRYVEALRNKGSTEMLLGRIPDAIEAFRTVLAIEPDDAKAEKELGTALISLGRIDDAERHFVRAVEIDPEFADARINLAAVQMQKGDFASARVHLERAVQIDPAHPNAQNNLGTLLMQTGNPERAEAHFRSALRSDPGFDAAKDNLERLMAMAPDPAAKADDLERQLKADLQNPVLYWQLGRLAAGAGRLDAAMARFEQAIAVDEGFLPALNDAAALYAHAGNESKALENLQKIVAIAPGRADAHYNAACMYARLQQPEEAIASLKTAIQKGYRKWDQIAADPDLENIRGTEAFKRLMQMKDRAP